MNGCTAFCPSLESARHMALLSIMFASHGVFVVSQQSPKSGYSFSTATPVSISGSVHISPGMPQEIAWSM